MKKTFLRLLGLGALYAAASCAMAQVNVGVSVGIYQPGVYGRIEIGNYPPPLVINPRPVVIVRSAVVEPVYLYVPPGHQKHWDKHCREYDACGRPVYFVKEQWIRDRYEERRHYKDDQDEDHDHGRGHGRQKKHSDDD